MEAMLGSEEEAELIPAHRKNGAHSSLDEANFGLKN